MDRNQIIEKIRAILIATLHHEEFLIHDDLKASDVEGWDSLNHMMIISEIEKEFKIVFKLREINKLNNMGSLIGLIESKI